MSPTISAPRATRRSDDPRHLYSAPDDFDPTEFPIIARHFYGIEPLVPSLTEALSGGHFAAPPIYAVQL